MRIPCMYCGGTGTVSGNWCPVCRPGHAHRLAARIRHARRHLS